MAGKITIKCPYCLSKTIKKEGKRKSKFQTIQKYLCKDCNKNFTDKKLEHKSYPPKIILNSISYYNLGNSQTEVSKLMNQRFKVKASQRIISQWINQYKDICTFNKLRDKATKLYNPRDIILSERLDHQQVYNFQYHKAKLHLLFHNIKYNNQFTNISKFYEPIKAYLQKIPSAKFPHHIFKHHQSHPEAEIANKNNINNEKNINKSKINNAEIANNKNIISNKNNFKNNEQRASQIKFNYLSIKRIKKQNQANKLAKLALQLAATNKDRHNAIQNFFLINDSTTIAIEVPIYLTNWDAGYYRNQRGFIFPLNNYATPITGHIDILQIRNGLIHILDYKPDADKINAIEQLTIYAMALSRKLNLPLYHFKAAWFDENNYYEFFPLHAVYEKRKA